MPPLLRPAPGVPRIAVWAGALFLPLLSALAAGSTASEREAPAGPWQEALRLEYNAASREFARRHADSPEDIRIALAHASALLARQPRTQANVQEARSVLEQVLANTGSSTSAESASIKIAARLLLGRIAEDHIDPPRLEEARAHYKTLLREHAGHPLADQAAVHLALMTAFPEPGAEPLAGEALHARLDTLRELVRTPEARREIHALQGRLLLNAGDARAALPHLTSARAIGYRQPDRNADSSLSIANLARELGERDLALDHYRSFLKDRPRDARATTVRRLVSELEATAQPAAQS